MRMRHDLVETATYGQSAIEAHIYALEIQLERRRLTESPAVPFRDSPNPTPPFE
jgi:hypothetical protein